MASTFDRVDFASRLHTRRLGRSLVARARVGSTNDEAWTTAAAHAPDGTVVVADAQSAGRGRLGRIWHTAPGKSLALSVLLRPEGATRALGLLPLAAGLAVAEALDGLGARPALKWPNDVLLAGRKVAGVLCETRRGAAVVGVGVNLAQVAADFPAEIAERATSLALVGIVASREAMAAAFLDAFEARWEALAGGDAVGLLAAWSARADFWGRRVVVRTSGGETGGVARGLDAEGALRLELADGGELAVRAGDLELGETETGT